DNIPDPVILTAIDNCDDTVNVEFEEKTTTDGCSSTLERIWTATDCAGNITNHTQIITIEDKQAPVPAATSIGYLENSSVSCGEIPEPPILAFEDNCTLDLSIHYSQIDSVMDPDGGYQITRLWKVSDQCNNTAQFTQLINITPNGELKFNQQPEDLTVNCGSIPEPGIISATNGCEIDVPVTFTETLTGTQCSPIIERQWTATDSYGNSITHLQTIKIEDIQAPVFVEPLPEDQTLYCSILPEPITLTAVDQCDSNLVVEMEEITTTEGCKQITTRTWNVSDCAGNSTSHTQTIALIVDQEAPTLTTSSMELFKEEITISCANIPEAPQLEFQDHCSQEVTVIFEETSSYV